MDSDFARSCFAKVLMVFSCVLVYSSESPGQASVQNGHGQTPDGAIPPPGQTYLGVAIDQYGKDGRSFEDLLTSFEDSTGKNVALLHWFVSLQAKGVRTRFVGGNQERLLKRCGALGKIPLVNLVFEFHGKPRGWASFDEVLQGDWDTVFQDMVSLYKDFNGPVIIALNHEMNGRWASYSEGNRYKSEHEALEAGRTVDGTNATTAGYVAAWRYVVNFFRSRGAQNVDFAWVVSGGAYARPAMYPIHYSKYYPGDEYVDWVGWDAYNNTPIEALESLATELRRYGKPMMVKEWGTNEKRIKSYPGGPSAYPGHRQWMSDYLDLIERHSDVRALVYFNRSSYMIERDNPGARDALAVYSSRIAAGRYLGNPLGSTLISSPKE